MALDITRALRALDPEDPVKYDFSVCHLGMMSACGFQTPRGDSQCPSGGVRAALAFETPAELTLAWLRPAAESPRSPRRAADR